MAQTAHHKVIILGSGPAGFTAAIYTARANLQPVVIQGLQPGGQLTTTTEVDNFPGFEHGVQGPELMRIMQAQAERFGTRVLFDTVVRTELGGERKKLVCDSGDEYTCDALIIATGASARWLNMESEQKYRGFGVSACATCDGFFFRDQEIAVVGGGNSAVEEALFLTKFASKVYLIHRRDEVRAEKILRDQLLSHEKIQPVWHSVVDEFLGTAGKGLTGLRLRNVQTGQTSELPVTGCFIAIGHSPNVEIFGDQLDKDAHGFLVTKPGSTATNIAGVFAAGDVQDPVFRQAITAAGTGCMAALEAERWLQSRGL
ncbi:MAG: thioredoxin-disulfide reductase [Magnetococcus sp. WYHC-3]